MPGFVLTLIYPWQWNNYLKIWSSLLWLSQGFIACCSVGCHQMISHLILLFTMKWLTGRKAEAWHPCSPISASITIVNILCQNAAVTVTSQLRYFKIFRQHLLSLRWKRVCISQISYDFFFFLTNEYICAGKINGLCFDTYWKEFSWYRSLELIKQQ